MNTEPQNIEVSLSAGVTIVWRDGHASRYNIAALRKACPCATCTDAHGTGSAPTAIVDSPLPMFKPTGATLEAVEPVGRYALNFIFSDGHKTGIYTWEYLRSLCPCAECAAAKAGAGARREG